MESHRFPRKRDCSSPEALYERLGRNFAVIAPGRTILEKTVANFTPGHKKSVLGMEVKPVVITSVNFDDAANAAVMEDDAKVKLFIFTVQSLLKPTTKQGRKTHEFREGLGSAFYAHLQELDDLIVFADEHHAYYGKAFSAAIRDLSPYALIGLTATPHKDSEKAGKVIYRYPLAAAIADKLVKTPVVVGRKDDRKDIATKLNDGITLLEAKRQAVETYVKTAKKNGKTVEKINPVMLVIAPKIEDAEEIAELLRQSVAAGKYADNVLTVHSKATGEKRQKMLADLDAVEDPTSSVRIIVSVGMLKEGWDVKNVFVIASLRSSISDVLTEQTLGRGTRLPFSAYTEIEMLDTLEVLAHDRYEALLKKTGVLNQAFVNNRTRAVLRLNMHGQLVATTETTEVEAPVHISDDGTATEGGATVVGADERKKTAEDEAEEDGRAPTRQEVRARADTAICRRRDRERLLIGGSHQSEPLQETRRATGDRSGEGVSARALERNDRVRPGWSSSDEARHRTGCRSDPGIEQRGDPGRCEARAVEAHLRCRDRHAAPEGEEGRDEDNRGVRQWSRQQSRSRLGRLPRQRRRQPDPDAHGGAAEGGDKATL